MDFEEIKKEWDYFTKLKKVAQENYDALDNNDGFKFSIWQIMSVYKAIQSVEETE